MFPASVASAPSSGVSRETDERAASPGPASHGSRRPATSAPASGMATNASVATARSRGMGTPCTPEPPPDHLVPRCRSGGARPAPTVRRPSAPVRTTPAEHHRGSRYGNSAGRRESGHGLITTPAPHAARARPVAQGERRHRLVTSWSRRFRQAEQPDCPGGAETQPPGRRGSADRGDLVGGGAAHRRPGVGMRTAGVHDPGRRGRPGRWLPRAVLAGRALRLTMRASSRSSPTRTPPRTRSVESMSRT